MSSPDRDARIREVLELASRIAELPDREVRQRYHELVDARFVRDLTTLERFELERIVARLDAEDADPALEAREGEWETNRRQLLDSVEDLLIRLRSSHG